MITKNSNFVDFYQRYRVTAIKEEEAYQYYDYKKLGPATAQCIDEYVHKRIERMVTVTLSAEGLDNLIKLSADKDSEYDLLRIPQVRDAYNRYKVIASLYRKG